MSYRDYLAAKGFMPLKIETTDKKPGHLIISAHRVERVSQPVGQRAR